MSRVADLSLSPSKATEIGGGNSPQVVIVAELRVAEAPFRLSLHVLTNEFLVFRDVCDLNLEAFLQVGDR